MANFSATFALLFVSAVKAQACDTHAAWIGDRWCDSAANTEACAWDGGDCCAASCGAHASRGFTCGIVGFNCLDPAFAGSEAPETTTLAEATTLPETTTLPLPETTMASETEAPETTVTPETEEPEAEEPEATGCDTNRPPAWIGDGWCDTHANTEACAWDGGDCCAASCRAHGSRTFTCGIVGFNCLDPAFAGSEETSSSSPEHTEEATTFSSSPEHTEEATTSSSAHEHTSEAEVTEAEVTKEPEDSVGDHNGGAGAYTAETVDSSAATSVSGAAPLAIVAAVAGLLLVGGLIALCVLFKNKAQKKKASAMVAASSNDDDDVVLGVTDDAADDDIVLDRA